VKEGGDQLAGTLSTILGGKRLLVVSLAFIHHSRPGASCLVCRQVQVQVAPDVEVSSCSGRGKASSLNQGAYHLPIQLNLPLRG
jgi:hypothetical protein